MGGNLYGNKSRNGQTASKVMHVVEAGKGGGAGMILQLNLKQEYRDEFREFVEWKINAIREKLQGGMFNWEFKTEVESLRQKIASCLPEGDEAAKSFDMLMQQYVVFLVEHFFCGDILEAIEFNRWKTAKLKKDPKAVYSISELRALHGFTKVQTAHMVGVQSKKYERYEAGLEKIPQSVAYSVAKILKVDVKCLFEPIAYVLRMKCEDIP
jgi:DNA-binding XRE family transcriptional regulator